MRCMVTGGAGFVGSNLCQKYTGQRIPIKSINEDRPGDIRIYMIIAR